MRLARSVAALSLVALIAACSWLGGGHGKELACPVTQIAPDLDQLTVLRPGGDATPDSVQFGVKLVAVNTNCERDKVGIRNDTRMTFLVSRNDPALQQGEFTYFVAMADGQHNVLAKQEFTLRAEFGPRQNQMRIFDDISEHLPVRDVSTGNAFFIVVGLQLTPEQLELNRKRGAHQ